MLYEGGPVGYAEGGLHDEALAVKKAGRNGDGRLVHINDDEFADMVAQYGEPTINPETGMPEFFLGGFGKLLKGIAKVALPIVATAVGGPLAGAAVGAGMGALDGGGLKGALLGGVSGGLGGAGASGAIGGKLLGSAASSAAKNALGNAIISGGLGAASGRDPLTSAISGAAQGYFMTPRAPTGLPTTTAPTTVPSDMAVSAPTTSMPTTRTTLLEPTGGSLSVDPSTQGLIDGTAGMPFDAKLDFKPETQALLNSVTAQQQQQPPAKKPNFWNQDAFGLGVKNKYAIPLGVGAAALYDLLKKKEDTSMPSREDFFGSSFNGGGGGGGFRLASIGKSAPSSYEYDRKYFNGGGDVGDEGRSTGRSFAVQGPGTGRSDEIPAMLSDGEYVIDAETVALLGDGSPKAGAKRLDDFRVQIRKQKGRNLAKGKISHDAKRPEKYMAGGRI
jgi:hypothetical protein